ncbi:O-succinylhomoserine sulfhydrylase [Streptomyces glaucescens]
MNVSGHFTGGDGTRAVRAGLPEPVKYEPTLPGPVFAAHFHLPGEPTGPYTYGRDENPTWTHLEAAIGELEAPGQDGVETLVFASGMAAISSVLFSQLRAGDVVVLPSDGYQVLPLVRAQLEAYGVEVRTAPTGGDAQLDVLDGAKLLWIESPSNPGLDVCDIRRLVEAAHARGALVAVDNTLATPLGQRPLELGADFSVASGTKQLTGHGDVLLGYVTGRAGEPMTAVRRWRKIVGAIPGPMEAWLAHRSIATLQLRVERQNATALLVAEALRQRPEVTGLRYPGCPATRRARSPRGRLRRFGCVVSFTLPTRARADRFLEALRLVDNTTARRGAVHGRGAARTLSGAGTRCRRASSGCRWAPRIPRTSWRICCGRWTSRRTDRPPGGPHRIPATSSAACRFPGGPYRDPGDAAYRTGSRVAPGRPPPTGAELLRGAQSGRHSMSPIGHVSRCFTWNQLGHISPMTVRPVVKRTARAVLLDGDDPILIKRTKPGVDPYWVTPGGGVEPGDPTVVHALHREVYEELGAKITDVVPCFVDTVEHIGEDACFTGRQGAALLRLPAELMDSGLLGTVPRWSIPRASTRSCGCRSPWSGSPPSTWCRCRCGTTWTGTSRAYGPCTRRIWAERG